MLCNSDAQPVSNGDMGVKVTEIMSGSLLSAKLGREITVDELYELEALRAEPTPGGRFRKLRLTNRRE